MRPLHKWLALAVPAALAVLVAAAPTASSPSAAAPAHVKDGMVHVLQYGLVKDCVYIQVETSSYYIEGNGPNKGVSLTFGSGSCFNLMNKFSTVFGTTTYTGYEYQDLSGHCLWANESSGDIEVGAACQDGDPDESFFGIKYISDEGWLFTNAHFGPGYYMESQGCDDGASVYMYKSSNSYCEYWNFPS